MTQPLVHPKAFSLQIFLPSGDPQGVRIIDRANWTGQGVAFSRSHTKEALNRPELQRTGVYILWTRDDADALPPAYIGEAEQVSSRLYDHARNKDFWTNAVAFTTKDDSLDKASVQHLEARLVELANAAGRCTLENAVVPKLPSLLEARAADAERFLEDILLCLPIIGVRFFEARALPASTDDTGSEPGMMTIDYSNARAERLQGVVAHGYENGDEFVIAAGSLAVREEADAFPLRFPHGVSEAASGARHPRRGWEVAKRLPLHARSRMQFAKPRRRCDSRHCQQRTRRLEGRIRPLTQRPRQA